MSDNSILLIILILCILIWINFLSPTAKAKKEEHLQKEAKDKENRLRIENQKKKKKALKKKKKQDELNEYLSSVRISKPGFILKAQIEFEREYKSTKNLSDFFGVDRSPLSCFGYVVLHTTDMRRHQYRNGHQKEPIHIRKLCAVTAQRQKQEQAVNAKQQQQQHPQTKKQGQQQQQ